MRGGYKPGGGRPRKPRGLELDRSKMGTMTVSIDGVPVDVGAESPVEYLLRVMRDPAEDPNVRLRAAAIVAPFVHRKLGEHRTGPGTDQKERTEAAASDNAFAIPLPKPRLVQ